MKKTVVLFLLALAATGVTAAPLDDFIQQARGEYGRGNAAAALALLGMANATNPAVADAKNALADAYTDIGAKEYDRRNFKNAYECFKTAVKLSPTNQTASRYFWKMRNETDVEKVRNEADEAASRAPPPSSAATAQSGGAATGAATGAVTGAAAGAQAVDSAAYKAAQEKLAKTEAELEKLMTATGQAKNENAALRADLEKQKKDAEAELEKIKTATGQAKEENAALRAELEKQKKDAEQGLDAIRKAALAAAQESAAAKAEIERQKAFSDRLQEEQRKAAETAARQQEEQRKSSETAAKLQEELRKAAETAARQQEELRKAGEAASKELETLRRAADAAAQENSAVKAEIERQKALAQKQQDELQKSTLATRDENYTLRLDLGNQKTLIDQLKERVTRTDETARKDAKTLTDMLNLYQQSLENTGTAGQETTRLLGEQIAEQRRLLEEQARTQSTRTLMIIIGFALLGALLLLFLLLIVRAQIRRRRDRHSGAMSAGYPMMALGAETARQTQARLSGSDSLLLEVLPESKEPAGVESTSGEAGMYRDLLKAERLKRMHDQMKQGALKWETLREYIGDLEKDLRVEILKLVETRIQEGDGIDPRAILSVLSPFLTEHDDYLREKAESLVKGTLSASPHGRSAQLALPAASGAATEADEVPLGFTKLFEMVKNLKKLLKDRERSVETAKIARGIGQNLGFTAADADMLYKSALAHDAGYLQLDPDRLRRILGKQALSDADLRFIQGHARRGLEYFKGVRMSREFKGAIVYHHERNDGSGYPKGLKGANIPLFAKIIGVAETYVALTSSRPYREKLDTEAALAVIKDGIVRKFDREHVNALVDVARRSGEGS